MNKKYDTVIGLEIHVALLTESKFLCSCSTKFGAEPNTHCCPVCLGLPGSLPVVNERAVELAVRAGSALNCNINPFSQFDRKNYFYPDLPKAYQITQNVFPLCGAGYLDYYFNEELKRTEITRIHLEEEAGKLIHSGESIVYSEFSLVDYNRAGIPLIEIVTAPDITEPEQARLFLEQLRLVLNYAGVSDTKMEEGSLRCDANISLKPKESMVLGTKVEIKNLNSFRALERALEFEKKRQGKLLERGGEVLQESRTWDDKRGKTMPMRSKADAPDYRFFPEPDLPPLYLAEPWIAQIRESLPELPIDRLHRLEKQYGLSRYEATFLVNYPEFGELFEDITAHFSDVNAVINFLMGDYARLARAQGHLTSERIDGLLQLIKKGAISYNQGKDVLEKLFKSNKSALEIVEEKGWRMLSDREELQRVLNEILEANAELVQRFQTGETKLFGFLMGQVMQATQGKADPQIVNKLLRKELERGRN